MKTYFVSVAAVLAGYSPALAATGTGGDRIGILGILFIAFGVCVIAFQLIPGIILFATMIKGLFVKPVTEVESKKP